MALDAAAAAPVEHLDHASTMEIGDHGRKLAAGTMVRRVERQPLRRPGRASGPQLVVAVAEGARDLIAAGLLLAARPRRARRRRASVPAAVDGSAR
jgi:hypothetical protein